MKPTFATFLAEVTALLDARYGLNLGDVTELAPLRSVWAEGDTPDDFVEWKAQKVGLIRIDRFPSP